MNSHFGAKSLAEFLAQSIVVAEIVNEWLPPGGIHIVAVLHVIFAQMDAHDFDFDGCSAGKFAQARISFKRMNLFNPGFELSGTLFHSEDGDRLAGERRELSGGEFVADVAKLRCLLRGYGIEPGERRQFFNLRPETGEGRLTTQSGLASRLMSVFVSRSSPRTMVHPSAQNEEIGARLVDPS
jgi:hypothetical protein